MKGTLLMSIFSRDITDQLAREQNHEDGQGTQH